MPTSKPHFDPVADGDDHGLWSDITSNHSPYRQWTNYVWYESTLLALDNNRGGWDLATEMHNDEQVNSFCDRCQLKWNRLAMLSPQQPKEETE